MKGLALSIAFLAFGGTAFAEDLDEDTYDSEVDDCDDSDPNVNPGATEVCNHVDDDCNTVVDDDMTREMQAFYLDVDLDGYGGELEYARCPSLGYIEAGGDCDENNEDVNPGAIEVCDLYYDNDCNGITDTDAVDAVQMSPDLDEDGYGDPMYRVGYCSPEPGWIEDNTDCHDSDASVNPAATEICDNNFDDNCDSLIDLQDEATCPS